MSTYITGPDSKLCQLNDPHPGNHHKDHLDAHEDGGLDDHEDGDYCREDDDHHHHQEEEGDGDLDIDIFQVDGQY